MSSKPPRDSLVSIPNHGYQFHKRKARNAAEAVVELCAIFFFFPTSQFSLPVYCGSGFWHLNEVLLFFLKHISFPLVSWPTASLQGTTEQQQQQPT
jgi:hypothetical protein